MGVIGYQVSSSGFIPNTTTNATGFGLQQQLPVFIFIETNDTLATVLTTGYLNKSRTDFQIPYTNQQMALVYTTDQGTVWLAVAVSGSNYSLQGTTNVSTIYEASAGSAAAPSYTFVGDTDTGLYHPAANQVGVTANGALVALISTAGFAVTGLISATTTLAAGTNITAGSASAAGSVTSFPGTANGSLILKAIDAGSAHTSTISNAGSVGQNTTYTLPDPGAATANFVLSTSGSGQTIAGGLTISTGNLAVSQGNVTAGSSGHAGTVTSFPGTAANGSLIVAAVNNAGNFTATVSNAATLGQSTVYTLADPGAATSDIAVTSAATVNNNLVKATGVAGQIADAGIVAANVVVNSAAGAITLPNAVNTTSYPIAVVNITVGQAALAAGGSVTLLASSASKQYQIIAMYLNSGGTNFSGGGGDRLGQVTDGTTVYSVVPAATMQALVNAEWGATALPLPAAAPVDTLTAAGAALTFKYSGGTVDYTAGSLVITVIAIQTA